MEEKVKKITKKEMYGQLLELGEVKVNAELVKFINDQIATLDKRSEASKARAAKKQAEGDAMRAAIEGLLTEELQTADDVLAQIDDEDITVAKVRARLAQLVKAGKAVSEDVKVEGKTRKGYKLV